MRKSRQRSHATYGFVCGSLALAPQNVVILHHRQILLDFIVYEKAPIHVLAAADPISVETWEAYCKKSLRCSSSAFCELSNDHVILCLEARRLMAVYSCAYVSRLCTGNICGSNQVGFGQDPWIPTWMKPRIWSNLWAEPARNVFHFLGLNLDSDAHALRQRSLRWCGLQL